MEYWSIGIMGIKEERIFSYKPSLHYSITPQLQSSIKEV
jgi:hypothetical protein